MNPPLSTRLSSPRTRRAAGVGTVGLLMAGGSLWLGACAGSGFMPPSKTGQGRTAVARLATIAARAGRTAPAQPPGDLNQAALDMRQLLDRVDAKTWEAPGGAGAPVARDAGEAPVDPGAGHGATGAAVETAGSPIPEETGALALGENQPVAMKAAATAGPPAETPQERRNRLIGDLALALEDEAKATGCEPLRDGIRLLVLDMLHPGGVEPELRAALAAATPPEARTLQTLRNMLRELVPEALPGDVTAPPLDPRVVARVLEEHAAELGSQQPLRVSQAALCTSVESFGRYTPFGSNVFLQGRAHTAILYVAVENFAQRQGPGGPADAGTMPPPTRGGRPTIAPPGAPKPAATGADDGVDWAVDLTESVSLFHDSDNLEVWKLPEEGVRDVAREQRADYYLVRRVQLPASLSLGRYNLKVTVKDRGGGGAAQASIPIEIVTDPALARGATR